MSPQFGRRRILDPRGEIASYEHSRRRARIIGRIVVGFLALVVLVAAGGILMVKNILDQVHHGPSIAANLPASDRPTPPQNDGNGNSDKSGGTPKNILIMGIDSRLGENSSFQPTTGPAQTETLSDTTILAHLSGDGKHVTLISIPRDSVVDIPACEKFDKDGNPVLDKSGEPVITKPKTALFNEAIQLGGPLCTAKTLEKLTNVRIDNYLEIDFQGVIKMANAIGGVPLTMCSAVHDAHTGLNLPAGPVNLKGDTALAFVRARYGLTGGDDLHRIQRQQQFMAAMVRKALSESNFFNILELNKFYGAVAGSLTTDMNSSQLIDLALRYRHIDTDQIVFATVPNYAAPKDSPWVQHVFWSDEAPALFDAIRNDRPLATTTTAAGQQVANVSVQPSQVSVRVLNGTTTNNLAHDVADQLAAQGFRIAGIGTASAQADQTTLTYAASRTNSAQTLAAALGATPQEKEVSTAGTEVTLTIGKDWKGLAAPSSSASSSPSPSPAVSGSPAPSAIPGLKTTNASTDHCVEG